MTARAVHQADVRQRGRGPGLGDVARPAAWRRDPGLGTRIVDHTLDHEADVIVLLPHAGVVVVEVKGGSVWYGASEPSASTHEPTWWQQGDGQRRIDPVRHAMRVKHAVREYACAGRATDRGRGRPPLEPSAGGLGARGGHAVLRLPRRLRCSRLPAMVDARP